MQHVVDDVFVLFASEWRLAAEHNEHDDAHRPNIALSCVAALKDLRCNIVRRSVWLVHDFVRDDALRETKINKLNMRLVAFLVQQEVLRLNVTVANAIFVQVAERVESLLHDSGRLFLCQVLRLYNMIEELAALTQSKLRIKFMVRRLWTHLS